MVHQSSQGDDAKLAGRIALLPCPFCGSTNIDPAGWATLPEYAKTPQERSGPACDDCGASADTIEIWNKRALRHPHQPQGVVPSHDIKNDIVKLFDKDTSCLVILLHLSILAKGLNDGPFKAGFESAIEEAGAYLDSEHKDGGDQMQTLMEQVIGLLNGSYALVDRPPVLAALPSPQAAGVGAWQPIETAPKDGREILVGGGTYFDTTETYPEDYQFSGVAYVNWHESSHSFRRPAANYDEWLVHKPTCWQPIPAPPSAALTPLPASEASELHPDTARLVNEFARALAEKLRAAEIKYGYGNGWLMSDWEDECRKNLHDHLLKGDPRDVAAFCAFMWHHGWSTATPLPAGGLTDEEREQVEACRKLLDIGSKIYTLSGQRALLAIIDRLIKSQGRDDATPAQRSPMKKGE